MHNRIAPRRKPQQAALLFDPAAFDLPGNLAFLGNTAKSSTPPSFSRDWVLREFLPFKDQVAYATTPDDAKIERFQLLSTARSVLPNSRTAHCCYSLTKDANCVPIVHSKKANRASFKNLQTCGSVWRCAVCAAKISEKRRTELLHVMGSFKARTGGQVLLVTRTLPHTFNDVLAVLMGRLKRAEELYKAGAPYTRLKTRFGIVGTIRNVEITFGENGFHPHIHELVFVDASVDMDALKDALFDRWASACARAGLDAPSREHGLDVRDGSNASAYVAKMGLEQPPAKRQWTGADELTKSHMKKGKGLSLSPFDLLRVAEQAYQEDVVQFARARFNEYAEAFHGKRQLVISPSLKEFFAEDEEAEDADIAAQVDPDASLLATLTKEGFHHIRRLNRRGEVLQVASKNDAAALRDYVHSLVPHARLEDLFLSNDHARYAQKRTFDQAAQAAFKRGEEEPCTALPAAVLPA